MAKITYQITLENVDLKDARKIKLEKEINALVASYLVKAVPADAPLGIKIKTNPAKLGIYLKNFKSPEDLKADPEFKKYKLKTVE
jgi:hypothetical protein